MGVRVAIDDYGTGYSSLAYLHRLPVSELKIDRSFVTDMCNDEAAEKIVRSTIDLAHGLGLRVVAEGVESQEAATVLSSLGADTCQGYFFARPMPAADFERWYDARNTLRPQPGLHERQAG